MRRSEPRLDSEDIGGGSGTEKKVRCWPSRFVLISNVQPGGNEREVATVGEAEGGLYIREDT
jgi:hypothetical protein